MSLPQMRGSESCQVRMASSQRATSSLSSSSPGFPRLLSRAGPLTEIYRRSCSKSMSSKTGMLPRRSADLHCPGAGIGVTTADSRSCTMHRRGHIGEMQGRAVRVYFESWPDSPRHPRDRLPVSFVRVAGQRGVQTATAKALCMTRLGPCTLEKRVPWAALARDGARRWYGDSVGPPSVWLDKS